MTTPWTEHGNLDVSGLIGKDSCNLINVVKNISIINNFVKINFVTLKKYFGATVAEW